jgi:glycosyltransferase involved in cell wall biosynthesis
VRLLLTTDFYHPFIGGAERQMQLLAEELGRRGHAVRVATTAMPGRPAVETIGGVEVHRLGTTAARLPFGGGDPARRFLPPAPDPELVLGMRRLIAEAPVDAVHASGWIGFASAAAVASDTAVPLVLSVRDYGYACATRNLLHEGRALCDGPALAKCLGCAGRQYGAVRAMAAVGGVRSGRPLLRRTVKGIHSVSSFVASTIERDLLRGDTRWRPALATIPDVVPLATGPAPELSADDLALLDRLPREPFLLFVGALQRPKGLFVLLEAWRRRADRPGGAPPLVCIGTRWPETPASFPDGVTVLSDVPHRVVMATWERAILGIAPSVWPDPLPGVVREAMTRGRPVVATAVGGNTDMIRDGETGLLVTPGDPGALAAGIARLLDDPALAERLGAAGAATVQSLTAPAVAERFEVLYERAIDLAAGRAPVAGGAREGAA